MSGEDVEDECSAGRGLRGDEDGLPCTHVVPYSGDCTWPPTIESFPAAVSPYGVRQLGSLQEFTSSLLGSYEDLTDFDPTGPTDPMLPRAYRGLDIFTVESEPLPTASQRMARAALAHFRCVY